MFQLTLWGGEEAIVPKNSPKHTVRGKTSPPEGWSYGTKHDSNCPACTELYKAGAPWTSLPWSETFWAS